MSKNLESFGEPLNPGQAHLLSNNTWKFKAFIRPLGRDSGFRNISPLTLSRGISRDLAGIGNKIVVLKDGGLLVEVCSAETLQKLLQMTPLIICGVRCFAYTPDDMVTVRGVIHNIPLNYKPEELVQTLEAQVNNTKVYIMKASRINNRFGAPTAAVTLTFFGNVLPECVRVTDSNFFIPVYTYIIPPLRCFKCQGFGHTANRCNQQDRCARCAGNHNSRQCRSTHVCCANCHGPHTSRSTFCQVYLWASRVQNYKNSRGCSWVQAVAVCGECLSATPLIMEPEQSSPMVTLPSQNGPRFNFKVNQENKVRTLQYINNEKTTEISHTPMIRPQEVKASQDCEKMVKIDSVENNKTPSVSPIKEISQSSTESKQISESSCSSTSSTISLSNLPSPDRGGRSSTPSNVPINGMEDTSLTEVTSVVASLVDVSSPLGTMPQTERWDTATQTENNISVKSTQTDSILDNNFMNKFDLALLLKNMRILLLDNNIKNGNFTENYLRTKFLSSFISSFQKVPQLEPQEDKLNRRDTPSFHPARRATPNRTLKPTRPNSLPKSAGSRLKTLNSPLKTVGGNRRFSLASPRAFHGVKKRIFKPY